ncbi:MAG: hypothetical protein IJ458_04440 [Clostridia bacterium]|nr:hypothetical protein [Clostridia bacterium]
MLTFEEYIEGLTELQKEYAEKTSNAKQTSLILDRIIANAQKEKEQLYKDLDTNRKAIEDYKKKSNKDHKFTVKVDDLRRSLAKVYGVKLRDISVDINVWVKTTPCTPHGYVSIDVKYDDVMCYEPNKLTQTYCIGVDRDTKFIDGAKLEDNLRVKEFSSDGIRYHLANGRKVKDLNVVISLTNGYMDDREFVEALRLCFKKQQNQTATITK